MNAQSRLIRPHAECGRLSPISAHTIEPALTIEDLMSTLRVKRSTIERMRNRGDLPAADFMVGRSPRWWPVTLRKWSESRTTAVLRSRKGG